MLLPPKLNRSLLEANTQETRVHRKGKFALFGRLATWGEGRLVSKGQHPITDQGSRAFKEEFQGCSKVNQLYIYIYIHCFLDSFPI